MAGARSRRLRLLEGLRRTLNEVLTNRVSKAATSKGQAPPPDNTNAIFVAAVREAPELLDQLLLVHQRAREESGEKKPAPTKPDSDVSDLERRKMLSAVRAAVAKAHFDARP